MDNKPSVVDADHVLISEIEAIRAKNNKSWMKLVRLAFKYAPSEARATMKDIVEYDKEIAKLSARLSEKEDN